METCRKSVATVLLLLIYLLTLRIDDAVAGRNDTRVENNPKIILEELTISGSGNNTRLTVDAVAQDAATIGDRILSLLSKREIQSSGHSKQTSSNLDQDAAQSHIVTDVNDEDDLERLKHVIAKYEPQRIISRKTKRKIVNGAHDVLHDKAAGSTTDLERAYDEVLRNISQRAPELISSNVDATLNPYLSQARKNLREIYISEAKILPPKDDKEQKSRPDTDPSSPTLKEKKTKKLLKKYLQLNRTVTIPRSSSEESRLNKKIADSNESSTPERYSEIPNEGQPKPKNESLSIKSSSNIYSESTKKPENRREWNTQDSSVQTVSPSIPQSNNNNSYNAFNVNNLNNLNFPSDANTIQSRYNRMPRPFSVLRSPDSPVTEIPYGKPSSSPTSFNRQQVARSSANVLPLILPTETLFTPSTRRYVAINLLKPEGDSTTHVNAEASPSANSASERTAFADHDVPYTGVIGTKSPLITVNNQRRISTSDYYAITENPAEQIATKTDSARLIHIPSQTSTSYTLQQEKNPQLIRRDGFLPRITSYNDPKDEKGSNLNSNAGLALYNKFGDIYSVNEPNVFNVPRTVTQNYQNFGQPVQSLHAVTSQHVSTPLYATSKPISTPLLKVRPIASVKPALAPYYNSGLVSQRTEEKELNKNKKNAENIEINESRAADVDESNTEASDNNNFENHKAQINDRTHKKYKTSNEREREDREEEDREDRYQQPKRNYGYQDKYYEDDKDNKDDKNNDKPEKYNIRHKDNKNEEEDVDETQEDEYVNTEKNEDQPNHGHRYQYNKRKYDRDDSEEEERDKQHYDRKKYDKENNRRNEHDHETDVKDKFPSVNKYFDDKFPRYSEYESREPDEKYRERYDRKKLHNKKDRDDEDSEDESVDEDKLIPRRSKDERAHRQRKEYEKKQSKDDKTTKKRKYHQAIPQRDSHHEEQKHEEYGETNPKHVHEEHRHLRQHVKDDDRLDSENDKDRTRDHEHGETQEHAHKHEEHHEKKKDGEDHEFEEGGGAEHKEEHHGHDGEKGHKGYKVWHEHEKTEKGHHDKEHGSKEYEEKDGEEKKHEEEGGFHKEHHRGEAGKKSAEFGEKGEHKKGHSTHGEHSVHKKDEYEKKTEFFDEFHEDGGVEKHGEHHHEHESKKGGHEKKGHHDAADHEEKFGKKEKHEKGGHHHEHKGHKIDEGDDHHYDHDEKYGKKEGHEHGKKWSFKKGDNGGHAGDGHNR
ncbi:protein phosphatase 1 regulatory subunit 12A-like [Cataglyphis hispanica]|uniref:protein phosphatase 1 regulatory subunit 12A-like n=1 Tax=Cataglyphis hispanica TaxID=1086592 RepID=UPI00217FBB15|nr:protein phosphatase 1 regulatory subunit 12A-like [Cataglyphis hispanica]